MNIRITQITLGGNLPQLFLSSRDRQQINLLDPPAIFKGWTAHGRGNTLWLVSPPAWTEASSTKHLQQPDGPRAIFRFPMTSVVLRFAVMGFEGVFDASLDKFDTLPFGEKEEPQAKAPELVQPPAKAPGK